jgi:hypothetical protein
MYTISCNENGFYVCENGTVISGPYNAEHKAKRRIRDLKAKEAEKHEAAMHCEQPFDVMATIDPDYAESFERTVPVRRVGCYPAVPKRAYRQDWR